jgi:hypothetical protein
MPVLAFYHTETTSPAYIDLRNSTGSGIAERIDNVYAVRLKSFTILGGPVVPGHINMHIGGINKPLHPARASTSQAVRDAAFIIQTAGSDTQWRAQTKEDEYHVCIEPGTAVNLQSGLVFEFKDDTGQRMNTLTKTEFELEFYYMVN